MCVVPAMYPTQFSSQQRQNFYLFIFHSGIQKENPFLEFILSGGAVRVIRVGSFHTHLPWGLLAIGFSTLLQVWGGKAQRSVPSQIFPCRWQRTSLTYTWKKHTMLCTFSAETSGSFVVTLAWHQLPILFCFLSLWIISPFHFSFVCSIIAGLTWRHRFPSGNISTLSISEGEVVQLVQSFLPLRTEWIIPWICNISQDRSQDPQQTHEFQHLWKHYFHILGRLRNSK